MFAEEELIVNVLVTPDVPAVNGTSTVLTVKPDGEDETEKLFTVAVPESVDIVTVTVLLVPASTVVVSNEGSLTVTAANTAGAIVRSDKMQKNASFSIPAIITT